MAGKRRTLSKGKSDGPGSLVSGSASGSCSASAAGDSQEASDSTSPRPTFIAGNFSLDALPTLWDNSPTIRKRVRDGMNLFVCMLDGKNVNGYVSSAREDLSPNQAVLSPVAVLMPKNSLQLPSIDRLIEAIFCFFATARPARSREHCYKEL